MVQINGNATGNEIELPVSQAANSTVQVLTSPLNGQFYVLGNANEVFTTAQTSRSLAPRATLQIETPRNVTTGLKKVFYRMKVVLHLCHTRKIHSNIFIIFFLFFSEGR